MNTEQTSLIQMSAHMVVTADAKRLIITGLIVAGVSVWIALCLILKDKKAHKWRYVAIFAALTVAGAVMATVGARQPRQKILYCCASGPVSLEMVATRYDIVEVDGKMLVLAER